MSNPKQKGNRGERELSKLLETHFDSSFVRVPSSGAFIGGKNAYRKDSLSANQIRGSKADIIPPDELPNVVFESKFYKEFGFHHFAYGTQNTQLNKWIEELEFDCDEDDIGFLCIKINFKGWFVCFHKKWLGQFKIENYSVYNDYIVTGANEFFDANKEKILELNR